MSSGIDAQFGFADESTYGTLVAPTQFLEFLSESLKLEKERIESQGIKAGRRVLHRWAPGVQRVTGDVEIELAPEGTGTLLKHMFGGVATTGASDPYSHEFTPGDLNGKSFTCQVGRPDVSGTVQPFTYTGCKIPEWELAFAVNEYLKLKTTIYGADETTAEGLAVASYPATYNPFVFTHGSLTVAGSGVDIIEGTLAASNALATDRHRIRSTDPANPKEPLENGRREFTGSLTADFESLTQYNRFVSGTEAAMVLTFEQSASRSLVVTMNVRFDGETPSVGGMELLEQSLPFKCTSGTSDAAAITAVLKNGDTTV